MKFSVIRNTVFDGSVVYAGAAIDADPRSVVGLERDGIIERDESEWPVVIKPGRKLPLKDVLVFTPVLRLEVETVTACMNLRFGGALSLLWQKDNPTDNGHANHLHQYQRARRHFLSGSYDAMLVVESDIIPPEDTLERLEALNADCAYGLYRFRVCDVVNVFELYPDHPKNMGESLTFRPQVMKRAIRIGQVPCSGAGLGCVLIRRNVLERIDFRVEEIDGAHCDTFFNRDVMRDGFTQWADMNVICGHKNEKGEILWPKGMEPETA